MLVAMSNDHLISLVHLEHWNHITKKLAEEVEMEKSTKAFLHYNGKDIAANKPGMTGEMKNFCLDESECLRKKLMTYLGSCETKSRTYVHSYVAVTA